MRNVFCQSLVEAASRPEFVFLTGDSGYKALEPLREAWGRGSSTPAWPSRTWSRSPPAWHGPGCAPGSTASRRSSTPGRSSRSATTSACTTCRSCWSATAAAMATA